MRALEGCERRTNEYRTTIIMQRFPTYLAAHVLACPTRASESILIFLRLLSTSSLCFISTHFHRRMFF